MRGYLDRPGVRNRPHSGRAVGEVKESGCGFDSRRKKADNRENYSELQNRLERVETLRLSGVSDRWKQRSNKRDRLTERLRNAEGGVIQNKRTL